MDTQAFIQINLIDPNPYQPRLAEDPAAVAELAANIKRNGLMQIPIGRQVNGRYQLAFGHTRRAAYLLNGEDCMPLIIRDLDDLQMFEMGVAENIKRRDLNPIEEARAMQRYLDEFGKTSAEAAEFFGCSPEKIRATVRLLDLPPIAQSKLAHGAINIEAARMILSMQRIAPEDAIDETVQKIEKGVDRWNQPATADSIALEVLDHLPETVRMWTDNRDGKPRSTMDHREEGWLISMKNFPNKKLPELTPVDAAIALGIQDDPDLMDRATVYLMWKLGDLDRDEQDLADLQLPVDVVVKINHLIDPPACSACPFYTRVHGVHYCGMKTCHDRKTAAWKRDILDHASRDLGIEIYEKKDGKFKILESYGDDEKLFEKRHADLRLISRAGIGGYHYQHFKGVKDWAFLVVLTGEALQERKAEAQQERTKEKTAETISQLRMDLIDRNRTALEWEASLHVKTLFDALNLEAIYTWEDLITMWKIRPGDVPEGSTPADDAPDTEQADFKRRTWAVAMIHEARSYEDRNLAKLEKYAERLTEIVKPWGIRLPRAIGKLAVRMDEEIAQAVADAKKQNKKQQKARDR